MIGKSCKNCFYSSLNGAPDVTRWICLECSRLSNFASVANTSPDCECETPGTCGDCPAVLRNCRTCLYEHESSLDMPCIDCCDSDDYDSWEPKVKEEDDDDEDVKVWSRDDDDEDVYGARNPLFMVDPTGKNPPVEIPANPGMTGQYTFRGGIEPLDFIQSNRMSFLEGNVIKYLYRYPTKGGMEALLKAKFYLNQIIEGYAGE